MTEQPSQGGHPLYDTPKAPKQNTPRGPIRILKFPTDVQMPYVTYALLAINVLIFVLRYVLPEAAFLMLIQGAADRSAIFGGGEVHRLVTAMFLHGSEAHILFNGLLLWDIGRQLERVYGHQRFILLYFLSGILSMIFATLIGGGGIGASGALFGIFGAYALHLWQNQAVYGPSALKRLRSAAFFIVLNFALGIFGNIAGELAGTGVRISNSGHLGGLIGGLLLGWFIGPALRVTGEQRGHIQPDPERDPLPAVQVNLEDTNPLQWRFIGAYTIGLILLIGAGLALGV